MKSLKIKRLVKLLLSSEIAIKLQKSSVYLRLVIVLYLLSTVLIVHSSLYLLIKLVLIFLILIQLKSDFIHQAPNQDIVEIKHRMGKWILEMRDGNTHAYEQACILIHNPLFQLLKLSDTNKSKFLILFNDQIPTAQLRLLHLKTDKTGI